MPESENAARCTQRAYLYLTPCLDPGGLQHSADERRLMAFDPDDVTRLVGLQPTRTWRHGDLHPRLGRRRFSHWEYGLAEVTTYVTEDVVTPLLDAAEPHAAGLARACSALRMRAGISVVIEMSGDRDTDDGSLHVSTAAITYSAETLKRIAQLNLSVEHDQYVRVPL